MLNDVPISCIDEDKFDRKNILKSVEQVIINLKQKANPCFTIGIFAKWGEGKTSFLNMLEKQLEIHSTDLKVVRYDPWFFKDQESLILDFFNHLSDKSLSGKISKIIKQYGPYVAFGSSVLNFKFTGLGGIISKSISKLIKDVPSFVKSARDRKDQINSELIKSGKHIVVMIDNVDRLDKDEMHAVFNLIKQTANFHNVIYIVAADKEIVAKSLASEYEDGIGDGNDCQSGFNFLEKLFQLQIVLPTIDSVHLWHFFLKSVPNLFVPDDADEDILHSVNSATMNLRQFVLPMMTSCREVILFSNILEISVPLVYKEVDITDFCLLESLQVFAPSVYERIKNSRYIITQELINDEVTHEIVKDPNALIKRKKGLIDSLCSIQNNNSFFVTHIIHYLLDDVNDYKNYSSNKLVEAKYFERYFMFSVPVNSMSDDDFKNIFVPNVNSMGYADLGKYFDQIINVFGADELERVILKSFGINHHNYSFKSKVCVATALLKDNLGRLRLVYDDDNSHWEHFINSILDDFPPDGKDDNGNFTTSYVSDTVTNIVSLSNPRFALIYVISFLSIPRHLGTGIKEAIKIAIERFIGIYGDIELMKIPAYEMYVLFSHWQESYNAEYLEFVNKMQTLKAFDPAGLVNDWFHKRVKGPLSFDEFSKLFDIKLIYDKLKHKCNDIDFGANYNEGLRIFLSRCKKEFDTEAV